MSVEIFRDDEMGYLEWLERHPNGFVVNSRRTLDPEYLVLHRARCTSIRRYSSMDTDPGGFTERGYVKMCSGSIEELEGHLKRLTNHRSAFSKLCSFCKPT